MAATGRFSYQRLRNEGGGDKKDYEEEIERAIEHVKARIRLSSRLKRVHVRKRLKMKIPSLKKFLRSKARVMVLSTAKILRRLKESQSHFGDLFAGNYLFMHVSPTPMKSASSSCAAAAVAVAPRSLRVLF